MRIDDGYLPDLTIQTQDSLNQYNHKARPLKRPALPRSVSTVVLFRELGIGIFSKLSSISQGLFAQRSLHDPVGNVLPCNHVAESSA